MRFEKKKTINYVKTVRLSAGNGIHFMTEIPMNLGVVGLLEILSNHFDFYYD